jgi:peptidoglycan/LPS O-acetylase OafA/YrhL
MRYRPEIDGLRAIAVTAVIFYHADVPGFGGGFVGVDVFFVISGYLITQVLEAAGDAEVRSRLSQFYLRRARRILPALLVMLLLAAAAAVVVLLPYDLAGFGRQLAAATLLLANLAAWQVGDYFTFALTMPPLQHLWSLGVEEQFYLAYPLALILCERYWPRYKIASVLVVTAASLAVCIWASYHSPVANFYLPPSRAWELLLGALVALVPRRDSLVQWMSEALAALCLATIAVATSAYSAAFAYPGLCTIPVCLATAGLLSLDQTRLTRTHRVLSLRPLVFLGLISYSLYLWHMPVIALTRYYLILRPGAWVTLAMFAGTLALSVVTWKWMEQPIRRRVRLRSNRIFLWTIALSSVALAAAGVGLWRSGGLPSRFSAGVRALGTFYGYHPDAERCAHVSDAELERGQLCRYGPAGDNLPTVIVWGDSHAMALLPAYISLATDERVRLYYAMRSSCKPLLDPEPPVAGAVTSGTCKSFNFAMLHLIQRLDPKIVILNAYWANPGNEWTHTDHTLLAEQLRIGLAETLSQTAAPNRTACIVLDPPTLPYLAPYALAMARRRGLDSDQLRIRRVDAAAQYTEVERQIQVVAAQRNARIVDLKDALCASGICELTHGGRSLYNDTNHLSMAGAALAQGVLAQCLSGATAQRPAGNAPAESP